MNFKQLLPYVYIAGGIFILISAYNRYTEDLERYRIIFQFYTEDKNTYIAARGLVAVLIIIVGVSSLMKQRKAS
jgi:hypothetical protein